MASEMKMFSDGLQCWMQYFKSNEGKGCDFVDIF